MEYFSSSGCYRCETEILKAGRVKILTYISKTWASYTALQQLCIASHSAIVPIAWVLGSVVLRSLHSILCRITSNLCTSMHVCIDGVTSMQTCITWTDMYSIRALILILFGLFINRTILDIASNCHDIVNSILRK